ncbi:MAG: transketolase C-terminal domain-containing protein, partial [Caldimicrobium sp.]
YFDENYQFVPGKADWIRHGTQGVIITYGTLLSYSLRAWEILKEKGISVNVLNVASIRPFPEDDIIEAAKFKNLLVVEYHYVGTGLGAKIASFYALNKIQVNLQLLGHLSPPTSGAPADLFKKAGLDPESIASTIIKLIS